MFLFYSLPYLFLTVFTIKERIVFDKSHGYKIMRNTKLKEMRIVRYADDFRIFCPTKDCAERTLVAVTQGHDRSKGNSQLQCFCHG